MASSYKRLTVKRFPRVQERETAEARYWRNFTNPEVQVRAIERRTGAGAVFLPLATFVSCRLRAARIPTISCNSVVRENRSWEPRGEDSAALAEF